MTKNFREIFSRYKGGKHDSDDARTKACVVAFRKLYKSLQSLQPRKEYSDTFWEFGFPTDQAKGKWLDVTFQEYSGVVYTYIAHSEPIEFNLKEGTINGIYLNYAESANALLVVFKLVAKQIELIKRDFVKYEASRLAKMPLSNRMGIIPRKLVWKLIPDIIRPEEELSSEERQILVEVFRRQYMSSREDVNHKEMTVNKYLNYCKVAYDAALTVKENHGVFDKNTTGREYYKSLSDGRYSHLLDINGDDPAAFDDWYHNRGHSGDHPWEILRGGNTTHIDLGVTEESIYADGRDKSWVVFLSAMSIGRMLETCKIAAALLSAGLPFKWWGWEEIKLRLEGTDHVGIMPEHASLHRGWQAFPKELHVNDVLHLFDFGQKRALAKKLIQWLPTESHVLAPVGVSKMDRLRPRVNSTDPVRQPD